MNARQLKVTMAMIADAVDDKPSSVRRDARNGLFDPADLTSVCRYVVTKQMTREMENGRKGFQTTAREETGLRQELRSHRVA